MTKREIHETKDNLVIDTKNQGEKKFSKKGLIIMLVKLF